MAVPVSLPKRKCMSSLIFATDEAQILVATDTLAVTPNGEPFLFASKATYVPHLRTIIAGTGGGGFSNGWALTVSTRMIVNGIHNLWHGGRVLIY